MEEMLALKLEGIEKEIHPHALRRYEEWRGDVQCEVPLEKLNEDDLSTFLCIDEKQSFRGYMDKIDNWLMKCRGIGGGYSPYPFATDIIQPMFKIKTLLKVVYQRKLEKAMVERRKTEEAEKQEAALKLLAPPFLDAEIYLDPVEYKGFKESISGAVDAYLTRGKSYVLDSRAIAYVLSCRKIKDRKKKLLSKIAAEQESQEFNRLLGQEAAKLKATLDPKRRNPEDYFQKNITDPRYTGQSFVHCLLLDEKRSLDANVNRIARRKLEKLVPDDFRQFIDWKYSTSYFPLPLAEYSFDGVPCLDIGFDVFAVVETRVYLKPGQRTFNGYRFNLPRIEKQGCSVLLQETKLLGYHYFVLAPSELNGFVFWQTIPLTLIAGLVKDELEPTRTTIIEASESNTTYRVNGFEGEVVVPEPFVSYLRLIGEIDEMVNMGILSQKMAGIIEKTLGKSEVEREIFLPSSNENTNNKDKAKWKTSKKAKAFQLFGDGKGPTSPEVKALGMHKSTRFKYYNQFLEIHKP